jgi:putative ABC transport system permease protein
MNTFWQDLRYGARTLRKQPGFTLIAVLTLALGIGANAAVFSVVSSVLWSPLPYPEPDRLVMVWSRNLTRNQPRFGVSSPDFKDWQAQNKVFSHLAAFNSGNGNLTGRAAAEGVRYTAVSGEFFPLFGQPAALGRTFGSAENQPGKDNVVVLSHHFWQRYFGGDVTVIGQPLVLDGRSYTILGVMPAGFTFPADVTDLWRPLELANDPSPRGERYLGVVARLAPGISRERAEAEMNGVAARLTKDYPATNRDWQVFPELLHETVVGSIRPTLFVLWGVLGCVLLIACVNVAGLLLARTQERAKELTVRAALGAGRARLMRQLLTESLLLAGLGGVAGILLAFWGTRLLAGLGATLLPRAQEVTIDSRVLVFTLALALLTNLLFGLLPAWQAARSDLHEALKEGAGRVTTTGRRARNLLVVGEIALALMVLVGAGLLVRSFVRLMKVETGFDPDNVLTLRIAPPWAANPTDQDQAAFIRQHNAERQQAAAFYQQLLERIEALPGVKAAAAINRLPLTGNWWQTSFAIAGQPVAQQDMLRCSGRVITPGYFRAMGVPMLQGRDLSRADRADAPRAVVVNQEIVRRYFAGRSPLGQRITFENPSDEGAVWFNIVGVVGNERDQSLELEPAPMVYMPFAQARFGHFGDWGMSLVVRTQAEPLALSGAVRDIVHGFDRNLPVAEVRALAQLVVQSSAGRRFNMLLLTFFAATALLLAAVGIYGVIAHTVTQRTQEIGIRMALGARRSDVLRLIVGQGLALAGAGITLGLFGAFALTRLMTSLLFGVSATDPLTFAAVALLLAAVALAASYLPARRATKVNPLVALRHE